MRKIALGVVTSVALAVSMFGAVEAAQAATGEVVLRNNDTGLCVDRPQEVTERPMQAFTAECDGAGTQRWVYSETEQTVRAADTGLCLGAGWATGVFVVDCGNGSFVNWVHGSDGRLRLREWQPGCLEDTRSEQLTWGGCDNQANEVWSLTTV